MVAILKNIVLDYTKYYQENEKKELINFVFSNSNVRIKTIEEVNIENINSRIANR